MGVWLTKRTLASTVESDVAEIRKAVQARELVVFETTAVTHRPAMTFDQACSSVKSRLSEENEASFVAAIDVARSRSGGITPLTSHDPVTGQQPAVETPAAEPPLPPLPDLEAMPEDAVEQKPTTPAARIRSGHHSVGLGI